MEEQEIYLLITRVLSHQTQLYENEFLVDWIKESSENEATFERIKSIWEARRNNQHHQDSELALKNLQLKLRMTDHNPVVQSKRNKVPALVGALLFLLIPAVFLFHTHFKSNAVVFKEVETKAGERISLNLSDGTKITLGPNSKLKVPTVFNDTLRNVYLTGEAFFEVSKNPHRPFIVHSGIWDTRVLGTTFDVSAFPEDSKMTVALVEGKVDVRSGHEIYHIIPGQQLLLNKSDNRIYLQNFNKDEVTGWVKNNLVFRRIPFYEAANRLERLYNVKIIFQNKNVANHMLWATFDNEPINQIMETIKIAAGIKYKIEGRIIYIME